MSALPAATNTGARAGTSMGASADTSADTGTVDGARTGTGPGAPAAAPRPRTVSRKPPRWLPVAPVVGTVLLLCVPERTSDIAVSGKVGAADVGSVVLVLFCGLRLLWARRAGQRLAGRLTPAVAVVLGAPAVAFAVATAASTDPAASLPGFVRYLQVFVLVPAAVLLTLRDARDVRLVCGALVLLALVQGCIGTVQNLTGTGASYMGENIRAVGTFGALDVMGMSTVVSYGLVAAFALGVAAPTARPWTRVAALSCAGALTVPLVLSYSRGAWIATAVACTAVLLMTGVRRAAVALAAVLAAAVVLLGASGSLSGGGAGAPARQQDGVAERFASITDASAAPDRSVADRYSLWSAATGIWRSAPVTGVGIKNFPAQRDAHAPLSLSSGSDAAGAGLSFQREPLLSPHDMYLLVLSEQGLLGTTALVGSWAALLVLGLRRLAHARRTGGDRMGESRTEGRGHAEEGRRTGRARAGGAASTVGCGVAAVGLLLWQAVDFVYSDIGGSSTVLTAVLLGVAAWWALPAPGTAERDEAARR